MNVTVEAKRSSPQEIVLAEDERAPHSMQTIFY